VGTSEEELELELELLLELELELLLDELEELDLAAVLGETIGSFPSDFGATLTSGLDFFCLGDFIGSSSESCSALGH